MQTGTEQSNSFQNIRRVLVTGAAGFIGSQVCRELLDRGVQVVGVDNLNDAYDTRLKHWRLEQLEAFPEFRFFRADVANPDDYTDIVESHRNEPFDAVINLAARAGVQPSVQDPHVYYQTNVIGTLNLLEFCRRENVYKFILASTSSLYGDGNPMPLREDGNTNQPLSPYAASKKAAEVLCYTYHCLHQIHITVFRFFTVYGPAGRPDMSPFRFVQRISEGRPITVFGDGQQSRDFTYIDDIVRGTVAGLGLCGFQTINLGSDAPVTLVTFIQMIEELTGRQAFIVRKPRHPADVQATWADITRARELLNWCPTTSCLDGLKHLVDWYRENRTWAREIVTR